MSAAMICVARSFSPSMLYADARSERQCKLPGSKHQQSLQQRQYRGGLLLAVLNRGQLETRTAESRREPQAFLEQPFRLDIIFALARNLREHSQ